MQKKCYGFIIVPLLLFGMLISCIALYSLSATSLNLKLNYYHLQRMLNFHLAQDTLKRIEINIINNGVNCLIPSSSPYRFVQLTLAWWQSAACRLQAENKEFYYVVEFLGHDPCAIIESYDNKMQTAQYYRITLYALSKVLQFGHILLQSTLTLPQEELSDDCQDIPHRVLMGRQSVRTL